jgi:hypothetical protein
MFTNHSTLKYLVNKPMLEGRICRWLLSFQEYEFEIIVKPGKLNAEPYHLSRITNGEEPNKLEENFHDANLFSITIADDYFVDIVGFLSTGMAPKDYFRTEKTIGSARYRLLANCKSFIQVRCIWNSEKMCDGA